VCGRISTNFSILLLATARVAELETQVTSLEAQLQEQENEASAVISQWQESYSASDEKCSELGKELETITEEKESLEKAVENVEKDNGELEENKSTLVAKILSLEDLLNRASGQEEPLLGGNDDLLVRLSATEEELKVAKETLKRDEEVVKQWEGMFARNVFRKA
jgi:chromosome segregation ATPase